MNICRILKFLLLYSMMFRTTDTLLPIEFKLEGEATGYIFPPIVYAHFLYFLCHFHLNNHSQYHDALRDLQLTIEES